MICIVGTDSVIDLGCGQVLWHTMTLWIIMDIGLLVIVWYMLHPWPRPTPRPIPSWSVRPKMWLSPSRRTRKARNAEVLKSWKGQHGSSTVSRVARYWKLRLFRTKSTHFLSANFASQLIPCAMSKWRQENNVQWKTKQKSWNITVILQPMMCFVAEKKHMSTRRTALALSWRRLQNSATYPMKQRSLRAMRMLQRTAWHLKLQDKAEMKHGHLMKSLYA